MTKDVIDDVTRVRLYKPSENSTKLVQSLRDYFDEERQNIEKIKASVADLRSSALKLQDDVSKLESITDDVLQQENSEIPNRLETLITEQTDALELAKTLVEEYDDKDREKQRVFRKGGLLQMILKHQLIL